ncbi:pyrroloquinoline quinone biosynthesis peptide chaperone PqqD (plasmid) [Acinetobacter variabilis]|uniref:PqqA binding protein n=1 Tax=Acinetobacter variabilis TaxID=70346 RepID=N8VLB4_9GAMM|nr:MULTISPECIES: pyrroloquinoline quinone biosynthesis peptide chaperone PqqD [Acinetobacter]EXA61428.1 coenzyme PQQ biosynthesis protein PqqD [Acinetobacter baumannii 348935]ENV00321.1 coenzyme PQQ biosynthesis protein PqqD [Acinetobacter variabilis]ENX25613.1 coenzyme PQQ biosynthesis protein PqqD [Acinetobacter sp. CIP 102136]ENX26889.1 coenzyme PQQ biosynthesis protein PqqD [Acinetobacter sp. CIP 64.7]QXR20983.1 pyrroloquinoline quinone biosynthesis peptide chaperone PqqD [Acinetobacter va
MSLPELDLSIIPTWRQGYRFQFEPAQNAYVLLYPEGMIKLNESASEIGQYIDGQTTIADIIQKVTAKFGDIPEIKQDIIEYMLVAQREHWIDLA